MRVIGIGTGCLSGLRAVSGTLVGNPVWLLLSLALPIVVTPGLAPAGEGRTAPPFAPATKIVLRVEIDVNAPAALENCIAGLNEWRRLTDTVMVSVVAGRASFYYKLKKSFPTLKIIPGLKTSPVLGHRGFDSPAGWRSIAEEVRVACHATGSKQIQLENESALREYVAGRCDVDLDKLRKGLELLPRDVEYIWYPSAAGSGERLRRYIRLDRVVEEVLNVRFIDHATLNSPKSVGRRGALDVAAQLEDVAEKATIPLIYCCGEKWWPFERIPEAMRLAERKWGKGSWSLVYPGYSRLLDAPGLIEKALRESTPSPEP